MYHQISHISEIYLLETFHVIFIETIHPDTVNNQGGLPTLTQLGTQISVFVQQLAFMPPKYQSHFIVTFINHILYTYSNIIVGLKKHIGSYLY